MVAKNAKQERIRYAKLFYVMYGKVGMGAQLLIVPLFGVGTVNGAPSRKGCVVKGQTTSTCVALPIEKEMRQDYNVKYY